MEHTLNISQSGEKHGQRRSATQGNRPQITKKADCSPIDKHTHWEGR